MKLVIPKRGGTEEPATKTLPIKIPPSVWTEVNQLAMSEGYSRSRFTFHLLLEGLKSYKQRLKRLKPAA